MKSLAELVQDLPVEIFDMVYGLTFTTNSSLVEIDGAYKPPSCLQVNQETRARVARPYYSTSNFRIDLILLPKWINRLSPDHSTMLNHVRVSGIYPPLEEWSKEWLYLKVIKRYMQRKKDRKIAWVTFRDTYFEGLQRSRLARATSSVAEIAMQ